MLRRRTMYKNDGGDTPPPPKPTENCILLDINCDDGSVTFNNNGSGITYKKVTTNMTGMAEITSASNKNLKIDFNKNKLTGGETIIKIKAYVDTVSAEINQFFSIELGKNTWNDCMFNVDFASFNAANITTINFIFKKDGGMSNLKKFEMKNFNAPNLVDMYNKKAGGFWEYGIFNNIFGYGADVIFTNCSTPKLKAIKGMFQGAGVKTADLSGLDTTSITDIERLFDNCYNINVFKLMYPMNNVTNTAEAFTYCNGNATFYYNKNYDYSKLPIPKGWKKTPV